MQTHRYREQADGCQRGRELGGLDKRGEGIKKYKLVVTNSNGDVKYNIENVVNNSVITIMYGARWVVEIIWGNTFYSI